MDESRKFQEEVARQKRKQMQENKLILERQMEEEKLRKRAVKDEVKQPTGTTYGPQ